mmetsp:Transcript_18397/g.56631  ORF Transcript_18397/g.56631 Transcript_18397/m.56631 type:complete len:327 (-) Transcript_18397:93-1073(-)
MMFASWTSPWRIAAAASCLRTLSASNVQALTSGSLRVCGSTTHAPGRPRAPGRRSKSLETHISQPWNDGPVHRSMANALSLPALPQTAWRTFGATPHAAAAAWQSHSRSKDASVIQAPTLIASREATTSVPSSRRTRAADAKHTTCAYAPLPRRLRPAASRFFLFMQMSTTAATSSGGPSRSPFLNRRIVKSFVEALGRSHVGRAAGVAVSATSEPSDDGSRPTAKSRNVPRRVMTTLVRRSPRPGRVATAAGGSSESIVERRDGAVFESFSGDAMARYPREHPDSSAHRWSRSAWLLDRQCLLLPAPPNAAPATRIVSLAPPPLP